MMGGMSAPVSLFRTGSLRCIFMASLSLLACVLLSMVNILASFISTGPGPYVVRCSVTAED